MKKREESAYRDRRASGSLLAGALIALGLFGILLWMAILSIDGASGIYKSSPDAPESLVSLGAPRSQLDLERAFSAMKREYDEDGALVCEPITLDYRNSVERTVLSVEEILYIISDSAELYDKCDKVRLIGEDGRVETEILPIKELSVESVPYYKAAEKRSEDILSIITYRIFALSKSDVISEVDGKYVYIPEYADKSFTISDEISFNTEGGRSVRLYPTEKQLEAKDTAVICESKRALGRAEREVLNASGYDADAARNVTPEFMYGKTAIRLVALGGRIILVDVDRYVAFDPLSKSERLSSVALLDGELYFTSMGNGSSLWRYADGESHKVYESDDDCLGIYGDGETIGLYVAKRLESKKYITALVREGEPVLTIEK